MGNPETAMEKLVKGRESAVQLQNLLRKPSSGLDGPVSAADLAVKILTSFTDTLSMLNSCDSGEVGQVPGTTQVGSSGGGDRRSVDSSESGKMPAVKDRKECYKRSRKTSDSWVKVSPSMEDEYGWRKYGQKEILNAKFPRCYFRCTYKHSRGCKATKQVQRIQEEPHMYQTTYFGHHACKKQKLDEASQNIISHSDLGDSYLLSFESKSPKTPSLKEESHKEEAQSDLSMPLEMMRSGHEDLISSSNGLDVDFFIKSLDFDNSFCFDDWDELF